MKKRIVTNHRMPESFNAEVEREFELISPPGGADFTDAELAALLADADAYLCMRVRKVLPEWLDGNKRLRVIGNVAVGYDNIDVSAMTAKGVAVVNTPRAVCEATAEHAIALMLSIARGIVRYHGELTSSLRCSVPFFFDRDVLLYGKTLSILGCGRVGKAVARKAQGLGMRVLYYDPFRLKEEEELALGLVYAPFDEAIARGDVVSLHMPYTRDTHHLIGAEAFARMQPSAYFVNTARGPIVDEAALIDALGQGRIRGAALDVFEHEPEVSSGLAALDNVVIVPHAGTMLMEVRLEMVREAVAGICAVLAGERPPNLVTR